MLLHLDISVVFLSVSIHEVTRSSVTSLLGLMEDTDSLECPQGGLFFCPRGSNCWNLGINRPVA